jgi:hypothetical protein
MRTSRLCEASRLVVVLTAFSISNERFRSITLCNSKKFIVYVACMLKAEEK